MINGKNQLLIITNDANLVEEIDVHPSFQHGSYSVYLAISAENM